MNLLSLLIGFLFGIIFFVSGMVSLLGEEESLKLGKKIMAKFEGSEKNDRL